MRRILLLLAIFTTINICAEDDGRWYGVGSRPNPAAGCKYTRDYGMETVTFDLWGDVRVVTNPHEADILVYLVKDDGAADLVVTWVDDPYGCGQWHKVDKGELFSVCFTDSFRDASITIRYGDARKEYSATCLPY